MPPRTHRATLLAALGLAACGHDDAVARRPAAPPVAQRAAAPSAPADPVVAIRGIHTAAVRVAEAEDGAGAMVAATRPVAIEIESTGWPGRATDPVLAIGALRFRHYAQPSPTLLRFVAADGAALPRGVEVALEWGDDASTRLVVAASLP